MIRTADYKGRRFGQACRERALTYTDVLGAVGFGTYSAPAAVRGALSTTHVANEA
jgi:hypothetical protein